ncbi:MAG TPA: 4Fe-4S binding protein [Vicinamibacterales bacterium]|nr:4Fe-4S binding protein [Vicinamibacterales bacterium]HOQ60449.1 4Fe-4S binding protein [Vicinamibacterales bacterium]HPK72738.1 4Fe-4S binding protein [Vicinamibacterales bacterium]
MEAELRGWARRRGFAVAWGPAGVLPLARRVVQWQRRTGKIDERFASRHLSFARGRPPRGWQALVVAMPRPAHSVGFVTSGRRIQALFPPTYERYLRTFEDVRCDLAEGPLKGCELAVAAAPLKTAASLLGLVRYGRNNLTYAAGMGSYLQLLGYVTNARLRVPPDWRPCVPRLLDECDGCRICEARCPTGAISSERVLLRAELCLTLANETPGPWPSHVPSGVHHCLIGCLSCQRDCPANPELPVVESGVEFSEAETRALLDGRSRTGCVREAIGRKLDLLGQPCQEEVIGRNLRALSADRVDPAAGTMCGACGSA